MAKVNIRYEYTYENASRPFFIKFGVKKAKLKTDKMPGENKYKGQVDNVRLMEKLILIRLTADSSPFGKGTLRVWIIEGEDEKEIPESPIETKERIGWLHINDFYKTT